MGRSVIGVLIGAWLATSAALAGGEIYGEIQTTYGETLTGPIRWDKNENFWDDLLDAGKRPEEVREEGFRISIFGWKIGGDRVSSRNRISIPFGHIRVVERLDRSEALLILKGGEEIEVRATTSDLGSGLNIVVDDAEKGTVRLGWRSIGLVKFKNGPGEGRDAQRLYGTAHTTAGEFKGFVVWDRDESLVEDVLDGYDEEREDHEVPFSRIREIERLGSAGSRIRLDDGSVLELSGTNDVDDGHRGVLLGVAGLGTIEIDWSDLEKLVFSEPPPSPRYDSFDGGRRLSGTVRLRNGKVVRGSIVWDRDESYTWESLDGTAGGVEYGVRFSNVRAVKPLDRGSSEVALRDGSTLVLSGSTDVDETNRGLIVETSDRGALEIPWSDLILAEFD